MLHLAFVFVLALIALAVAMLLFYRFWFLRNPKRHVPKGNTIISPANGTIARILPIGKQKQLVKKGLLGKVNLLLKDMKKQGHIIVIMMTPFNVHYQRSPIAGTVEKTKYSKGRFLNAVRDPSSLTALQNEKNEITIKNTKIGKIKVIQVAGFLARRIRCFVNPKQKIDKGQDIGLICLGSQVILIIPKLRLSVKEGQKVIDGETVIARF
jgi:phosphatidylserine decarboxylase